MQTETDPHTLDRAVQALRRARRIAVLSGAGLSKASGIPTYRDADGLWADPKALAMAQVEAITRDYDAFVAFWNAMRSRLDAVQPNPGHHALVRMQRQWPDVTQITQNVDGLLQKAGARNVLELHGNLSRDRCDSCEAQGPAGLHSHAPHCAPDLRRIRPDVVLFGEPLDHRVLADAGLAATRCDVFLLVGTSAAVFPAAGLAEKAEVRGATIIEINPRPTEKSGLATICLRGNAEDVLPGLVLACQ
jgi:NAD-dependent deacetylase